MSVGKLFQKAEASRAQLDSISNSSSAAFQTTLVECIAQYECCAKAAEQVSLFSSNETLEDMATGDIPSVERRGWHGHG